MLAGSLTGSFAASAAGRVAGVGLAGCELRWTVVGATGMALDDGIYEEYAHTVGRHLGFYAEQNVAKITMPIFVRKLLGHH